MKMHFVKALLVGAASAVFTAGTASAASVDMTGVGSQTTVNGTLFKQVTVQPTGTGVIDTFVRIQAKGTEQGYNTDGRPVAFDEKTDPHTRSLDLNGMSITNIGGINYRGFLLDINEPGNITSEKGLLSLDQVKIYLSNVGNQTTTNLNSLGTKIYDLDDNADTTLVLRDRNSGSGQGDYEMFVPDSLFQGAFNGTNHFVTLFSHFGDSHVAEGGFEEWASLNGESHPVVPLPPAVWTGLITMGGAALKIGRKRLGLA